MPKERICVAFGGPSVEHEISIITALQVIGAIDTKHYEVLPLYLAKNGKWYCGDRLFDRQFYHKKDFGLLDEVIIIPDPSIGGIVKRTGNRIIPVDIFFPAFHGRGGEDGCIQGLLELAEIPYTGSGPLASALCMNKYACKRFLRSFGIESLWAKLALKKEAIKDFRKIKNAILKDMRFPLFVKPNHLGSSIGISKAEDEAELGASLAKVFQYDDQAIVEPYLGDIMELNIAVLEGDPPLVSHPEIPVTEGGFLSYDDKYKKNASKINGTFAEGMASLSRVINPSDLDPEIREELRKKALRAFRVLGCAGLCRFDFLFDLGTGGLYFNEANPIPGSFAYYLWDSEKILFSDIIERMIEGAKKRNRRFYQIQY